MIEELINIKQTGLIKLEGKGFAGVVASVGQDTAVGQGIQGLQQGHRIGKQMPRQPWGMPNWDQQQQSPFQ